MPRSPIPRHLKKALELIEADPARTWRLRRLAVACGTAPRTLQRQFALFLGRSPGQYIRALRLDRARQELLRAAPGTGVTEIATRCGFSHLGRFSAHYRTRYGESPSRTLKRCSRMPAAGSDLPREFVPLPDRPSVAVLPFNLIGPGTIGMAAIAEEIAAQLWRLRWLALTNPSAARYHVRGKVVGGSGERLRVLVAVVEARTGRYLWADRINGRREDIFELQEQVAARIANAIQPSLRGAEIDRAWRTDRAHLNAWELTMRALPCVIAFDPASENMALELLERAMELAPQDALPVALASWCRGLRAGHHFTKRSSDEKNAARSLAERAARLKCCDPLAETLLAGGYTLAHDLPMAAVHSERALMLDGGSAWAWGRSGWVKTYSGEPEEAVERFQLARSLTPTDPLGFLWTIGIGAAHFEAGRYAEAARWYVEARAEQPTAVWNNRFLAPALARAGRWEEAKLAFAEFACTFPGLTIGEVRAGLPYSASFLDRIAEALESLGMTP